MPQFDDFDNPPIIRKPGDLGYHCKGERVEKCKTWIKKYTPEHELPMIDEKLRVTLCVQACPEWRPKRG